MTADDISGVGGATNEARPLRAANHSVRISRHPGAARCAPHPASTLVRKLAPCHQPPRFCFGRPGMPAGAREASNSTRSDAASPLSSWPAFLGALNVSKANPLDAATPSDTAQAAWLSVPLVRFLRALFSPRCTMLPRVSAPQQAPHASPAPLKPALNFTQLPDEIVSMCYAPLQASDLVSLELVSRRLHSLISADSVCWRKCARDRWGAHVNAALLGAAARHAGSWKALYAQKLPCELSHRPWIVPCSSETAAMLDLIKGAAPRPPKAASTAPAQGGLARFRAPPGAPPPTGPAASSPRAVSALRLDDPTRLSVVLLIDGSSSVTEEDFKAMKQFAEALVQSLGKTHPTAALALVQFNQHPKVEAPLTPVTRGSLRHAIVDLEQMMGSTDIAAPIRRAREMLADEPRAAAKAIVLLTDGQTHADELQESELEARTANNTVGARIFTLGVGRDVDVPGLTRVATGTAIIPADAAPAELSNGCYFTLRCLAPQ